MYFQAFSPHALLRPYISRYIYIRITSGRFHFPADGCPGFIINLGDPFLLGFEKNQMSLLTGCRLFGSSTRYMATQHVVGQTELLAVKYRPGQLPRFFNVPASELTDTSTSLGVLCGVLGREIEDRLCDTKNNIPHTIALLDDTLIKCLSTERLYDQRISVALDSISRLNGQVRIEQLAAGLDLSRRHFERRFLDFVGLTPKRMCRITRFLSVFSSLQAPVGVDWADLAVASGYSDQAHLVRECKYFTGQSPIAYLTNRSFLEHRILGTGDA